MADSSGAASGTATGSMFGPWGTVIGGVLGAFANKKRAARTAPFTPISQITAPSAIDAGKVNKDTIDANLTAQGGLEQLLSQSNKFQQGQASSLLEQAVPGFGKLSQSILSNSQQAAEHPYDLPPEVQKNLSRIAAEKGIKVGSGGQTQQFSALRDLGTNMLDYGNQNFQHALSGLSTVTGLSPRVSPMSPLSFMLTPGQGLGVAQQNQQTQFDTQRVNAGINQFNSSGAQQTQQGQYNAGAAAMNFNNQNVWDNLIRGISAMPHFGGPATKPSMGDV